jgi:hypothetical protein
MMRKDIPQKKEFQYFICTVGKLREIRDTIMTVFFSQKIAILGPFLFEKLKPTKQLGLENATGRG